MRTKTIQVQFNRIRFVCPECDATRTYAVPPDARRRTIRCPKCSSRTQCILNRRAAPRESQTGRCLLVLEQGKEIEINLHDISLNGLGFTLPHNAACTLKVRQVIQLKCTWNPGLLRGRYVIRNINGNRVGAQKI